MKTCLVFLISCLERIEGPLKSYFMGVVHDSVLIKQRLCVCKGLPAGPSTLRENVTCLSQTLLKHLRCTCFLCILQTVAFPIDWIMGYIYQFLCQSSISNILYDQRRLATRFDGRPLTTLLFIFNLSFAGSHIMFLSQIISSATS